MKKIAKSFVCLVFLLIGISSQSFAAELLHAITTNGDTVPISRTLSQVEEWGMQNPDKDTLLFQAEISDYTSTSWFGIVRRVDTRVGRYHATDDYSMQTTIGKPHDMSWWFWTVETFFALCFGAGVCGLFILINRETISVDDAVLLSIAFMPQILVIVVLLVRMGLSRFHWSLILCIVSTFLVAGIIGWLISKLRIAQ